MADSYIPKVWADNPTGGTPVLAASLNRIEQAIADLYTQVAALRNATPATTTRTINYTAVADRAIKAVKEPADWASTNNVKLLVGEFGWPATNDAGYNASWDNDGDAFLAYCDSRNLPVTQWSSSEWGLDLKAYRNADNSSSALTTVTNVGVVKARHGTKPSNLGVNLAGAEFGVSTNSPLNPARGGTGFRWSTQATWQFLAAQGQRVIRLPFSWERMQPTPLAALDSTYLAALQQQLGYATAAGLKVIIDCHNYARYTFADGHLARIGETYNGVDMQAAFVDLWTRLSTALKNHAALAATATVPAGYGLCNEPHTLPIGSNSFEAQTWQKASEAAHYAIRNIGDTTSGVFVSGYFYASARDWVSLNGATPWHYRYGPDGTAYANKSLNLDPLVWWESHLYMDGGDGGIYNRPYATHLSEAQTAGFTAGTITALTPTTTTPVTSTLPRLTINSSGVIQRSGVKFRTGGANVFQLVHNDYPSSRLMSHSEIDSLMDKAVSLKAGVVRAHTLGVNIGSSSNHLVTGVTGTTTPVISYNTPVWEVMDYAVKSATDRGVYLMVPMTDELGYYHGGKRQWVNFRRPGTCSTDGNVKSANSSAERTAENYFYSDSQIKLDYKTYIKDWLTHVNQYTGRAYKDEPAIAFIETGNELWTADDYRTWTPEIAAYIKTIAPNTLVADGMSADGSSYWASQNPPQDPIEHIVTTESLNSTAVDLVGIHPYSVFTAADITTAARRAAAKGKAFGVGEYPWSKTTAPGIESASRAEANIMFTAFWSLQNDADLHNNGASYGGDDLALFVPGKDSTQTAAVSRLQAHSTAMNS